MAHSRRANAVFFGFSFQINAAIVLFLENVKDVKYLRLEGNYEDIELELDNGQYILAQAKAVENASVDFGNVRANMKKSMLSLSEGAQKVNAKELIMVTNSPNPFNDDNSKSVFYGHAHRKYSTLPESAKKILDSYLSEIEEPLDRENLKIQVIPFETDDDAERYKVILECINDFVGELNISLPGLGRKMMDIWQCLIQDNGGKKDAKIKLTKKDMIWPILVKITELNQCDEDFLEQFETGVYEEIVERYSDTIEDHCERCEFFIKILSEYNNFKSFEKRSKKLNAFIEQKWEEFVDEFATESIDDEIKAAITKIVMYYVIKRRWAINRVKEETNL